jgi:hypothetical protein
MSGIVTTKRRGLPQFNRERLPPSKRASRVKEFRPDASERLVQSRPARRALAVHLGGKARQGTRTVVAQVQTHTPTGAFHQLQHRKSMERSAMNTPSDNVIWRSHEDGDPVLPRPILQLWARCLSVQRSFEAEVIFNSWLRAVHWFVPRDHPHVSAIKPQLTNALEEFAASKPQVDAWCPRVHVNEYPGISGALASHDTVNAMLGRASELGPHCRRVEMALVDEDGDLLLTPATLQLWAVCLLVQRTFEAEVIFKYWPPSYGSRRNEVVSWYVPHDHPEIGAIKLHLTNALEPICQSLAASKPEVNGWRPRVHATVYEYAGITGALAFHDTVDAILGPGGKRGHRRRRVEMAYEEGRRAARLAKRRH